MRTAIQAKDIVKSTLSARIYDVCKRTSIDFMKGISKEYKNNIWIKREDQQPIFSFKIRGAYHKLNQSNPIKLKKGVITASAGNHAQGVALSAKIHNVQATIYMPKITANIKIEAVNRLGSKILLIGNTVTEAYTLAKNEAEKTGALFIEGFNDPEIIAGQGTIGLEIIQDCPQLPDYVFVPIGGGGLIAGIAILIKSIHPNIKIIGVEPNDSNSMNLSIKNSKVTKLSHINTFSDGVAVNEVGDLNFKFCQEFVDGYIEVTTDEICSAIKIIHHELRALPEPSGALSTAGALKYIKQNKLDGKNIATINSGSNMDFERLKFIADRTKIGEGRELLLIINLEEAPGTLRDFCRKILYHAKISEFNYRYHDSKKALIFLGLETDKKFSAKEVLEKLNTHKFKYHEVTNDEIAKYHLRYMLAGTSELFANERFFQFTFPENYEALYTFLVKLIPLWNISLFHYRSYSGQYGKVLMGIQSDKKDKNKLDAFINSLHYKFTEETNNTNLNLMFH